MFTIGREREIEHAIKFIGSADKAAPLIDVIEQIHNFLDGDDHNLESGIITAFSDGCSGVWESSGSWLRKACNEESKFSDIWETLCHDSSATVRYRVACFLDDISEPVYSRVSGRLLDDRSKKVREMALARVNKVV